MIELFETAAEVARHKTAIGRSALSRPVKLALMDGILTQETKLFDYGRGRGDDLRILATMGFEGGGWDPVHRPEALVEPAPVVNLGYVVNVIENEPGALLTRHLILRTSFACHSRLGPALPNVDRS